MLTLWAFSGSSFVVIDELKTFTAHSSCKTLLVSFAEALFKAFPQIPGEWLSGVIFGLVPLLRNVNLDPESALYRIVDRHTPLPCLQLSLLVLLVTA